MEPKLTREEYLRYSRHLLLPEIGLSGQKRLKTSSALIVGLGGLGSPVAFYLAAAGVGRIGLADFDGVDLSNLQRQILHGTGTLGMNKAASAAGRLADLNPDVRLDTIETAIQASNAAGILSAYEVVVDATDNFATRYLLNDACFLQKKPLVHGSVHRFEGQAAVFNGPASPCYRCAFPTPPPPELVPSCDEGGVLGSVPGVIGAIQATETIKLLLGIQSPLQGALLLYDAVKVTFQKVHLRKNPDCLLCGDHPVITTLEDEESFARMSNAEDHLRTGMEEAFITVSELENNLQRHVRMTLLDVREPHELEISRLPGSINIPFSLLGARLKELDKGALIVTLCRTGERSHRAMHLLRAAGFTRTRCLEGGINAWAARIDPTLPQY